jgi:deaminated glutathione amidase
MTGQKKLASFTVACLQVNASNDLATNLDEMANLTRKAAAAGAEIVLMPENLLMMEWGRENIIAKAMPEDSHKGLRYLSMLAKELGIWLHCGSLSVLLPGSKVANRTYVLNPNGIVKATYDKIHMFDVDLGPGERYSESKTFRAGSLPAWVDLPWGRLGLTICYDLRFPGLYRHLARSGAHFLTVPSAFTKITGEAHWHVLMRARAIETGCFVFAPAQSGSHGKRETYGHALIVNPWGEVLADAGEKPGFITANIDPDEVAKARARIPSLSLNVQF